MTENLPDKTTAAHAADDAPPRSLSPTENRLGGDARRVPGISGGAAAAAAVGGDGRGRAPAVAPRDGHLPAARL
jgi:hypothetical protein